MRWYILWSLIIPLLLIFFFTLELKFTNIFPCFLKRPFFFISMIFIISTKPVSPIYPSFIFVYFVGSTWYPFGIFRFMPFFICSRILQSKFSNILPCFLKRPIFSTKPVSPIFPAFIFVYSVWMRWYILWSLIIPLLLIFFFTLELKFTNIFPDLFER
jgi:hypothetical protein